MKLASGNIWSNNFWKNAACLLVLAVLLTIVFWPALFEGRLMLPSDHFDTMTLPFSKDYGPPQAYNHNLTDALMQSYPWKVEVQDAFRKWEFYFWNPLILNGYPQYATSRQVYDVFNILLIPFDLPVALTLILVLQLFTAGAGMFVLLRVLKCRRSVALFFAAAWMFNGMFLTHLLNLWATASFCWLPFGLSMVHRYSETKHWRYAAGSGIFLGLSFLGSTLQSGGYVLIAFTVVAVLLQMQKGSRRNWKEITKIYFFPLVIAAGISAIMWIPALELFLEVLRHGTLYSPTHAHHYSIVDRLLSFVLLGTFFVPETMGIVRSISLTSVAGVHPLDFSGYIDVVGMVMAVWALCSLRSSNVSARPYAWLIIGGFLLPIFTPLFAWLYHRFFIVGTLGLVVLGAERFETFVSDANLRERGRVWARWALRIALVAFGILAIGTITWSVSTSVHHSIATFLFRHASGTAYADGNEAWVRDRISGTFEHFSIFSPMMLIPFGVLILSCILFLRWNDWRGKQSRYFVLLLFILGSVQNIFWWRSFLPMLDAKQFPLLPSNNSITFLQRHLEGYRVFIDRRGYPGKQYLFLDNIPSLYDIPVISGYESEVPRSFYPQVKQVYADNPHPRALGQLGVKYLVFVPGVVPLGTLPIADSGAVTIYEDTFARPRAALYYSSEIHSNDSDVLKKMFDETDPHLSVLFSASEHAQMLYDSSKKWEAAKIIHSEDRNIEIAANPSRKAYLVLSDTYYPGWGCFVDGKQVPILRANYAMRAVLLDPGNHRVQFRFEPKTFTIGAALSACSALLVAFGFGWSSLSRKKDSE